MYNFEVGDKIILKGIGLGTMDYLDFFDIHPDFEDYDEGEIVEVCDGKFRDDGYVYQVYLKRYDGYWYFHKKDLRLLHPFVEVPIKERIINKIRYIDNKRKGLGYVY